MHIIRPTILYNGKLTASFLRSHRETHITVIEVTAVFYDFYLTYVLGKQRLRDTRNVSLCSTRHTVDREVYRCVYISPLLHYSITPTFGSYVMLILLNIKGNQLQYRLIGLLVYSSKEVNTVKLSNFTVHPLSCTKYSRQYYP